MLQPHKLKPHFVRLLLLAMADFDFGEAAQNMIDKIQSGTGPGKAARK